MTFFDYIKNIFLALLFLQIAPTLIENISKQYGRYIKPKTQVGVLKINGVLYDSSHYNHYLHKYFEDPANRFGSLYGRMILL